MVLDRLGWWVVRWCLCTGWRTLGNGPRRAPRGFPVHRVLVDVRF